MRLYSSPSSFLLGGWATCLSLLLLSLPQIAHAQDVGAFGDGEHFVVYHLSAKAVGNGVSWYEFGVLHLKDQSMVYCLGVFNVTTPSEQRVPCGVDNVNVRVQQPPSLFPGDGFAILVNWNVPEEGPTGRVNFELGLPGFIQPIGSNYNWFLPATQFDYGP